MKNRRNIKTEEEIKKQQSERNYRDIKWIERYGQTMTGTIQHWVNGIMITALMTKDEAIAGVKNGEYFIITCQAVGNLNEIGR